MESFIITILLIFNLIFYTSTMYDDNNKGKLRRVDNIKTLDPQNEINRINAVPVLYVEGSHYEVGFIIGNTFRSKIQDFVKTYKPLKEYLEMYNTNDGKIIYKESLDVTTFFFPQYISELKGIANGSKVPFHKLFLIQLDNIPSSNINKSANEATGSTTLIVNRPDDHQGHIYHSATAYGLLYWRALDFIAHNEDALKETLKGIYIVNAHIKPGPKETGGRFEAREEIWEAVTYAGSLSGYTSGHNHHGLVFTIDTIFTKNFLRNKIPRNFLTRALLASKADIDEIEQVLTNEGVGSANAFHVNVGILKDFNINKTYSSIYSIEVTPNSSEDEKKSIVIVTPILSDSTSFHVNRLPASQNCEEENDSGWNRSAAKNIRYAKLTENKQVESLDDILNILGDTVKEKEWQIYTDGKDDDVQTINTGVFDFVGKNWILWTKNPKTNSFVAKLPLAFPDLTRIPEETALP